LARIPLAVLAFVAALAPFGTGARAEPLTVSVQFLWAAGADADRQELDRFADCLLHNSNFAAFWSSLVAVTFAGSTVVAPPAAPIDENSEAAYITSLGLPTPADQTVYVFLSPAAYLSSQECGANAVARA
jgi:hypothetical protein